MSNDLAKLAQKMATLMGEAPPDLPDEEDLVQRARGEEAVIAYTLHPELFTKLQCANESCSKTFAVSRANVATCSTKCRHERMRKMGLEKAIGLVRPTGPKDIKYVDRVWLGREPLVVSPEALVIADEVLDREVQVVQNSVEATENVFDLSFDFPSENASRTVLDDIGDILG